MFTRQCSTIKLGADKECGSSSNSQELEETHSTYTDLYQCSLLNRLAKSLINVINARTRGITGSRIRDTTCNREAETRDRIDSARTLIIPTSELRTNRT